VQIARAAAAHDDQLMRRSRQGCVTPFWERALHVPYTNTALPDMESLPSNPGCQGWVGFEHRCAPTAGGVQNVGAGVQGSLN